MKRLIISIEAEYPNEADIDLIEWGLENAIQGAIDEGLLDACGYKPTARLEIRDHEDSQGDTPACKRCGSPMSKTLDLNTLTPRCTDETCPFSDCEQSDDRGWRGHPEKDPNPKDDLA